MVLSLLFVIMYQNMKLATKHLFILWLLKLTEKYDKKKMREFCWVSICIGIRLEEMRVELLKGGVRV